MLTAAGLLLFMLVGYSKSLSNTRCFLDYDGRSLCFTQPDPMVALSWSSAMEWCKNIGGTLPLPENQGTLFGNVLGYFGLHTETLWLGANFTYDLDNWYWTNGSRFTGALEDSDVPGNAFAYIIRNGTDVKLVGAPSTYSAYFLCEYSYYSDLACASYYQDSYWTNGNCYVKRKYWSTWYNLRSYCGQTSSAIIDNLSDFSRWLEDVTPFWIGLRCSWWTWHNTVTGVSYEVLENQFGNLNDLFNGTTAQCLASNRDSNGYVSWTNMDCNSNLPFICQYNVDTTPANPGITSEITTTSIYPTPNPTFTPSPLDQTTASEITTTSIYPTPNPTFTPSPLDQTTASEIASTPINPTLVPGPTSTPTPLAMTTASVSRTTTHLPTFPTYPTSSPTSAYGVVATSTTPAYGSDTAPSVSSSTQTVATTSLSNSNSEAKPTIFGLPLEFFAGLGGGLMLAGTVWLTLITVYACKQPRGSKIFPE